MKQTRSVLRLALFSLVLALTLSGHLTAETDGGKSEQASAGCCNGRVGDVNGSGGDEPTIGDAIDLCILFHIMDMGGPLPTINCLAEADINQSGGADPTIDDLSIGDLSMLLNYLFIAGPETVTLPTCLEGGAR